MVCHHNAHCYHDQNYSSDGFRTKMLVKEDGSEYDCREWLKGTEYGCECRTDASYRFHTGEI